LELNRRSYRRRRLSGRHRRLAQHVDLAAGLIMGGWGSVRVTDPCRFATGLGVHMRRGVGGLAEPQAHLVRQRRGGVGRLAERDRLVASQTWVTGGYRVTGLAEAGGLTDRRARVARCVGRLAD
jgi:hypothetical protein